MDGTSVHAGVWGAVGDSKPDSGSELAEAGTVEDGDEEGDSPLHAGGSELLGPCLVLSVLQAIQVGETDGGRQEARGCGDDCSEGMEVAAALQDDDSSAGTAVGV